ncbi:glutathione S-transferase family protein [Kangiella sp.]|uniref:glutathione S-transferase family protein n=1 Tax=Kangiella sp. TaxID=1920245 RepID=UPI001993B210|nr:glutathione S-transferase family protein [Kangiella sp.]MBD3652444.1 glutathione S-transferase family protein [Kangiella sp.]
MKLYYAETANCYKTCAVAQYLKSPIEFIRVNLGELEHKQPEFLAKNPNGKVPVLDTDGGALWESFAIMCHLAREAGSDLWPNDQRQVEILRWVSWDFDCFLPSAGAYYYENIIKPQFNIGKPDSEALQKIEPQFKQHAELLNNHLKGKDFVVGNSLTLADFSLGVMLPYAEQAQIPLDDFPEIQRWHHKLMQLPAWRSPFPTINK